MTSFVSRLAVAVIGVAACVGTSTAQDVYLYPAPVASYYAPAPVAAYYEPAPAVYGAYYPPAPVAPVVRQAYYAPAPVVRQAYYAAPAPAVSATTYYGLFGRPRAVQYSYYP